jgi:hypothetical protein
MKASIIGGVFALSASACMHPMPAPAQSAPPAAPQTQVVPTAPGAAIGVAAYPLQQQDGATQSGDERYCWEWSRSQTGIDPLAGGPPAPPPTPPVAGAAGGAALGAAGGAAVGAIAGRPGRGAAIGSVVGAVGGHRSTRQANAAQAQAQAQAGQAQADQFKQAYASCLVGRGYSVQ